MRYPALILGWIALSTAPATAVLAQEHSHPMPAPATVAPARGYATDAALRQQMRVIRAEAAVIAAAQQRGQAQPAAQGALRLRGAVNTIIVACRLPPDSDAALHEIIGPILQYSAALETNPASVAAIAGIRGELARYAKSFDDPGFGHVRE